MRFAQVINGQALELEPGKSFTAEMYGVEARHNYSTVYKWSHEKLRGLNVYPIVETEVSEGMRSLGTELVFDPVTGVREVHTEELIPVVIPTEEELRADMTTLTARQFKLGLINAGISLSEVDDQIALITDPAERTVAEIEWTSAGQFERLHPLVVSMSLTLGLTPEQVDTLWSWSSNL